MKNNTSLLKGKAIHFCLLLILFAHCCFNNTANGQGTTTINASISLQTGYSNFFTSTPPLLSACYDHYQLNLDGIVLTPGCSLNVYVPQGVTQISFPTFVSTPTLTVEIVYQTPPQANYINLVNSSSTQTLSSLSLDINFDFDLCETSNEINIPLDFQLTLCTQSFTVVGDPTQAGFLNVDNSDPAKKVLTINVNRQTISLNTISSLSGSNPYNTIPNISSYSSSIGDYSTYGEVLERYYIINPESGISDCFTLNMEVESDLEILRLEAIKATGGNKIIFNDVVDPIPGGSIYQIIFYGTNTNFHSGTVNLPPYDAPQPVVTTDIVKVPINDCVYQGSEDFLYNNPNSSLTSQNFIIIHETVRVKNVNNCSFSVSPFETGYNLYVNCDQNYMTTNSNCSSSDLELNIKCFQKESNYGGELIVTPKYKESPANYVAISNNIVAVCSTNVSTTPPFYNFDFSINFLNNLTVNPSNELPIDGSGTVKINKFSFEINKNFFDYSSLELNGKPIPVSAITTSLSTGGFTLVEINFDDAQFISDFNSAPPNNINGLTDRLNDYYPILSSNRCFHFLKEGNNFNITLVGTHFINCNLLSTCDHIPYSFTRKFNVDYLRMCDMASPTPRESKIQNGELDLLNNFQGFTTADALPLDIAPGGGTGNIVTLNFSFQQTQAGGTLHAPPQDAFSLEQPHTANLNNIISCPNKEYYVRISMPDLYTPQPASFVSSIDGTSLASGVLASNITSSNGIKTFEYKAGLISSDFNVNFEALLSCNGTIGIDNFNCSFLQKCDNNCSDCVMNYACTNAKVNRHCPGACPPDAFVITKNFNLIRQTKGWIDEASYLSNPTTPNAVTFETDKVYPCDQVKAVSFLGSIGDKTNFNGVPNLTDFYFEIRYPATEFNSSTTDFMQLSNPSITPSFFTFSGLPSTPCSGTSFTVDIGASDVTYDIFNVNGIDYKRMRIKADKTQLVTFCGNTQTLEDFLTTTTFEVRIDAYFDVVDMPVNIGYYELKEIIGGFAYEYLDAGVLEYAESCDPYMAALTYFKVQVGIATNSIAGPTSTATILSQCELGYWLKAFVVGGYPNGNDFIGEFRPLLLFPSTFEIESSIGLYNPKAYFFRNPTASCPSGITDYNFNSTTNEFTVGSGCTYRPAIEKGSFSEGNIYITYKKSCVNTATSTDETLTFNDFPIISFPNSACSTNLLSSVPSISYSSVNDDINSTIFKVTNLNNNDNILAFSKPQQINFGLVYDRRPAQSDLIENGWVYFTSTNSGVSYNLIDASTLAIVPSNPLTFPGQTINVFELGDFETAKTKNYILEVTWTNCTTLGTGFAPIPVQINYGASCKGYSDLSNAPSLPLIGCYGEQNLNFTITPQQSSISLNALPPQNPNGCENISCNFDLSNTGADVNNTQIKLPEIPSFTLVNGTVNYTDKFNSLQTVSITTPTPTGGFYYIDLNLLLGTTHFNKNEFPNLLQFSFEYSPNNYNPANGNQITIPIEISGTSQCNIVIDANLQLNYIYSIPEVNFSGSTTLCNGNPTSISASLNPSSSSTLSYLWSNGLTTNPINVTTSGLYSVTITDGGCIYQDQINIANGVNPTITLDPSYVRCQSSQIQLTASNTCSTCTFLWSTGETTNTITTTASNFLYTVTVTDPASGCSSTASTTLTNSSFPVVISSNTDNLICTSSIPPIYPILTANVPVISGVSYSYNWTSPITNTFSTQSIFTNDGGGTYQVVVTNSLGCTATDNFVMNDLTPQVSFSSPIITSSAPPGTAITLTPTYSNLGTNGSTATFSWTPNTSNISSTAIVSPSATTSYMVTVSNNTSTITCPASATVLVNLIGIGVDNCYTYPNDLTQANFNLIGNIVGDYNLNSDVIVTGDVTIKSGSNIAVGANYSITIQNGFRLIIEPGVHIFGCSQMMWDGIIVNSSGSLIINGLKTSPTTIEHARIAIDAQGNTINTPNILIGGEVVFNENNIAIKLSNGDFTNATFNGAQFTCNSTLKLPYALRYSDHHILALNAGTIRLGGYNLGTYSNTFVDASVCIKTENTGLEIDNCSFERINNNAKGSYAIWCHTPNSSIRTKQNIGVNYSNNSGYKKNSFVNYTYSIGVSENCDALIYDNYFERGNNGIRVDNAINRRLEIHRNDFVNLKWININIMDCIGGLIQVKDNSINSGQPFISTLECGKGILIRNSSVGGAANLKIDNNSITNCKFGIQLINQKRGLIAANTIIYQVPDFILLLPQTVFRKGIAIQGSQEIIVNNSNYIERVCSGCSYTDPSLAGRLIGIYEGKGKQNYYSENTITNLPSAIGVYSYCPATQFECNTINSGAEGFRLIGDLQTSYRTLDDQGYTNHPNGNKWLSWGTQQHIFSTAGSSTPPFDWYYDPTLADVFPTYSPGAIFKQATSGYTGCIYTGDPEKISRIMAAIDAANASTASPEENYFNEQFAYQTLKDSLQLMFSGSVFDTDLQNFFTLYGLSASGQLENVNELINSNDLATAYLQNENITTNFIMEENNRIVNTISTRNILDTLILTDNERYDLTIIAYQYPHIGGDAVYRARAILGIDFDDTQIANRIFDTTNDEALIKIYPNPSKGIFELSYYMQEDEIANVNIVDELGRVVKTFTLNGNTNSTTIDLTSQNSEVYWLQILNNKGLQQPIKIILLK